MLGLFNLSRIIRERAAPATIVGREPGSARRCERKRRSSAPPTDGRAPEAPRSERDSGWIVSVDNFS
jgi:hypothetical protein